MNSVGKDPKSGDIKVNSMACKLEKTVSIRHNVFIELSIKFGP